MKRSLPLYFIVIAVNYSLNVFGQSALTSKTDTMSYHEKYRPQYHLTPPNGGLIDPTDLVYYDGLYHVNKGLATSPDLINWKIGARKSLSTDSLREMSGSLVIDSMNTSGFGDGSHVPLVAIYSGLRQKTHEQVQCIGYSVDNGEHWTRYINNPVIDIHSTEFRDPQVFWYAPDKKWIMVVALAAERKVRFYQSSNLKEWEFMSDFGPFGAVNGVWECPDFFRLPVMDTPGIFKWVLEVSVQPVGGQYFIGDFDGSRFIADPAFRKFSSPGKVNGKVIFDFENGMEGWKRTGDAFDASPADGPLKGQNAVLGYDGKKLLNSFNGGDKATGSLRSPSFKITKAYLNFLIGGGLYDKGEYVSLIVDNKVVRTQTGTDAEVLSWAGWDVGEFLGKTARIELVDKETGAFGHILFDELVADDKPAVNKPENAHWLDYGPDFYAVRSWVNGPDNADHRVSVAWLGNWQYAFKVPSNPWKGGHTFPRAVKLTRGENNYQLIQNPVSALNKLHQDSVTQVRQILSESPLIIKGISQNSYELSAAFSFTKKSVLKLIVCSGSKNGTVISYDPVDESLHIDRSNSGITGFSPAFPKSYAAPLKLKEGKLKLHLLVDRSSIELFANDGEVTITCQIFPDDKDTGLSLQALKGGVKMDKLIIWNLRSIWPSNQ